MLALVTKPCEPPTRWRPGRWSQRGHGLAAAALLLALAAGCSRVLGDVELETVVEPASGPAVGGRAGAAASGEQLGDLPLVSPGGVSSGGIEGDCAAGTVRCSGAALQLCLPDGSRWISTSICASPALCSTDPPSCQPPACALDELSCAGAVLQVCNAQRDGWEPLETCASEAYCSPNSRQCLATPCREGELSCNQEQLQRCAQGGLGWAPVAHCETQVLCEQARAAGAESCPAAVCESGALRCVGNGLERCNDGRSDWQPLEQCDTPALCQLSLASGGTACETARCEPGSHRCRAQTLTVCNTDLTGFADEQVCASAALCDPVSDQCQAAACQPGARRCNGAQIEVCNADRTGFQRSTDVACASASLCIQNPNNDVSCRAPVCAAGQFRCAAGGLLQRCSSTLDGFQDVRTCDSPALCDAALGPLGCKAPVCQSGEQRCQGTSLLGCRAGRDGFDTLLDCGALGCDPVALACRTETCRRGQQRCTGARLEECNAARTGFDLVEVCGSEALCRQTNNNARCIAPSCAPGEAECRRRGVLAVCNADLTGFDEIDCGDEGCDDRRPAARCAAN
jgi:hypothetical protein